MELAIPHVVVRVCGPGVGADLVAALGVHPVEVSEARDVSEMHRVADERPAILVVLVDPSDAHRAVSETWADFPGVPILVISDSACPFVPSETGRRGWVDTVTSGQSLQDICWLVLEAVNRSAHVPGLVEHPLGPHRIDVDGKGVILAAALTPDVAITSVLHLHAGDSLLSILESSERDAIAAAIEWAGAGETHFCTSRVLDERGHPHAMSFGMRGSGDGRVAILLQPLIAGGPLIGRHINNRDPLTGLLTRWAISRLLVAGKEQLSSGVELSLIFVVLDDFEAISHYIGHKQTDDVLLGAALALNQTFPHPSLTSRLMGDTFLACVRHAKHPDVVPRAERLLRAIGDIEVPGFAPRFPLRASIGVAGVPDGDYDLALRVAEAAAGEARAAGGNRVVDVGSGQFTGDQARQLTACMDLGRWEVWLQPVVTPGDGRAVYHEALARFDGLRRTMGSRADFFIAGQANGLLERFDRMMLQRALEILGSHPEVRLSVNVTHETFESETFPASFLDLIQRMPDGCGRIILEIASRCVAAPQEVVRPRLEALAAAGVAVAVDDFGSGICRLRYLTQYPLAIVKLDQLVTGYVDDDPLQREFVRTVVSICRARGITTVAEYTRSEEQLARLVADGVDLFQGELYGMPRPVADVLEAAAPTVAHA
ncbi:MAG: EAL domain-containing protein [Planctomycetaceae bacterium]